ncbi:MAG TPA: hypothetical protein EYG65_00615 [Rhodospirillales bacterium]|nr:hypothetical protein [Rhodospirillales bacterium]
MSQTLLFLLFMIGELAAILMLYQLVIIPRVAEKTNNLFEQRMLDKTWDIPAMLEDYTIHLTDVFAAVIKKLVPEIMGGYMSAGVRQLKADPENTMAVATAEFLDELPLPARLLANKFLPRLQSALDNADTKAAEPEVSYKRGLDRR